VQDLVAWLLFHAHLLIGEAMVAMTIKVYILLVCNLLEHISQDIYAIPSSISYVARLCSNIQNGNIGISVYIGNTLLNLFVVSSTTSWTTFSVVVTNTFQSLPQSLKFTNTYVSNGCSGDCTVKIDDIVLYSN
jgi:hypothetical protein